MKTFIIKIKVEGTYEIVSQAESREQAEIIAKTLLETKIMSQSILDNVHTEIELIHSISQ